ncbi:MAG: hypothetical protein AVDCRST_MAG59-1930 [uncultured Thermomicrobiales bacterium]|uniref:Uncharacterized protein n=1 Tax=uncultured Thermomicrobiales bacterium TaxID=1645740 RepID=A0A6J4UPS3_9BACT|nr:MAG: hypothetical protein AVDCRST_MAG59-1930 [uncultured Thermomicrobiales bacterium]
MREPVRTPRLLGGPRPWFTCPDGGPWYAPPWVVWHRIRRRPCHNLTCTSAPEGELDRAPWRLERVKEKRRRPSDSLPATLGSSGRPERLHDMTSDPRVLAFPTVERRAG